MSEAIKIIKEATSPMTPICLQEPVCKYAEYDETIKAVLCTKHNVYHGRKYRCAQKEV